MTGTDLIHMFEYDEWANDKLIEAAAKLDSTAITKDLQTSFKSVHGTLAHIYGAQRLWLERWKGAPAPVMTAQEEVPTIDILKQRWRQLHAEMKEYIMSLTKEQLFNPFGYHDLRGNRWSEPLYQQIQHLVFHSMYHRGQVATLLRQLGEAPPHTDLIVYYRSR